MAKQIKWKYQLLSSQRFNTAGVVESSEIFMREQLNDVNPFLIKFSRLLIQQRVYAEGQAPKIVPMRFDHVFYPEGMKELTSFPPIGSTNRWTYSSREFRGDSFPVAHNSPCGWIVSVLNNLDPSEAVYAKVSLEYQYGSPDIFTATVIVPQGAK